MKTYSYLILTLLILLFTVAAGAEPARRKAPGKREVPQRRVASLGEAPATPAYGNLRASRTRAEPRSWVLRLSLAGGYGFNKGSGASNGTEETSNDNGLAIAGNVDFQFLRYFGAELEGNLGLKSTRTSSTEGEEAFTTTESRSFSNYYLFLKGQVPLRLGRTLLVPKAGIGYGLSRFNDEESFAAAAASTATTLNAPMAMGGLEFRPAPRFVFSLDYARSVGGVGRMNFSSSDLDLTLASPRFDRIRATGAYRLDRRWALGLEYARRSNRFSVDVGAAPSDTAVSQDQVMALVQIDL